ncbi:Cadherin-like and PC-esterase [Desmophyllum pertusum]|uniref:Cadherin-like and PC-esterase n=1 Tax=Desmophyllum pertusum TaxID=174260 RepID=A0A9X0CQ50_9CNID|nr:Cadherin-like and PC-esterase [Desmophyllum pertusum]
MRPLVITDALRKEIEHWRFLDTWEGHLPWLEEKHSHIVLCTDASPFGWGGVRSPDSICLSTSDYWTEEHEGLSINVKEACALANVLLTFSESELPCVARLHVPAVRCPQFSYPNDSSFLFCQMCGYHRQLTNPLHIQRANFNLSSLDSRLSALNASANSTPYAKQKSSLRFRAGAFSIFAPRKQDNFYGYPSGCMPFSSLERYILCGRAVCVSLVLLVCFAAFRVLFDEPLFAVLMGSRQTNTSMEAALFNNVSSATDSPLSSANIALSVTAPSSVVVEAPLPSLQNTGSGTLISPELVAVVSQMVQAAMQAHQAALLTQPISVSAASSPVPSSGPLSAAIGSQDSLGSAANSFLASGVGFPPGQAGISASQGRPIPFVVPSFMSTFATPLPAIALQSASAMSGFTPGTSREVVQSPLASVSLLADQPFVVGLGFSPVPSKLVKQILAGKYIDLSELLAANLVNADPEPQLLFEGRLVLTTPPQKAASVYRGPSKLDQDFLHLLASVDLAFTSPMERFVTVSAAHSAYTPPF